MPRAKKDGKMWRTMIANGSKTLYDEEQRECNMKIIIHCIFVNGFWPVEIRTFPL